jgi:hypothetical protein
VWFARIAFGWTNKVCVWDGVSVEDDLGVEKDIGETDRCRCPSESSFAAHDEIPRLGQVFHLPSFSHGARVLAIITNGGRLKFPPNEGYPPQQPTSSRDSDIKG